MKKRLAFVIHSLQPGGMERVMSELASHLADDPGLEIHIVLYGIRAELFYTLNEKVVIHKAPQAPDKGSRVLLALARARFLRRTVSAIKPDAVLSFGEYWNSFVLISLLFSGQRIFVSDRCQPDKPLGRIHEVLRWLTYRTASGIVAQTEKARDIFKSKLSHPNIRIIGNPIRQIYNSESMVREKLVVSVGRLISSKHHDQLIRIFSRTPNDGWKLIIIGGDALKQQNMQKLQQMTETLGLQDKVILAGNQHDVERYYNRCSIFAFTSSSEGFPNVIGEAMSAGLPVVAYDCVAGPSDMINDGENGFLVPLFDERAFGEKLEALMRSEALRTSMGEKARMDIRRFSVSEICSEYRRFLLEP